MDTLGVILARAGSKGLPGKCLRPLLGRALIEYTLDHVAASRRLCAAVLTTDCAGAKQIAAARGLEVIDRPAELAGDQATVDAAARHAVQLWEGRHRRSVDAVALLYANVPVRAAGVIDRALALLERSGADSVRTVAPVSKQHPDWLHHLVGDRMIPFRANSSYRRQDLEPLYYHDGAVVAVRRRALFAAPRSPHDHHAFLGRDRRALVQRPQDTVDVDTLCDLRLAESLLGRRLPAREPAAARPAQPGVRLGQRRIGHQQRAYIVAEAGVNHDGLLSRALALVDVAAAARADAVKFQVFRAAQVATAGAGLASYQRARGARRQRALLARLELSDAALARIRAHCAGRRIEFLATPFSPPDVDRLVALHVRGLKIASTDLDNVPLLRKAAASGLPLILSTGASTADEIAASVARLRAWGAGGRLILLHCVSRYPTPLPAAELRAVATLRDAFGLPCGLSDHTLSTRSGAWAVAAGACLLEKHFTLERDAPGPDHAMSLDPEGLTAYVDAVRTVEQALGSGAVGMTDLEAEVRRVARRSVVAARRLPAGTVLRAEELAVKRPAGGIPPSELEALLGRRLTVEVEADAPLSWDMLQ